MGNQRGELMNLMRMKYFVEVAKWCSFSKAAQMLYVSQPNLSRQIALMEQELGFELFQRSGKSIQLTRAGEYMYGQFRELLELTERAIANAEAISRREAGSLSIGVLEGQDVNTFLPACLAALRDQFPGMAVEMERNSFRNLRQGLDRGAYDVILTLAFELEHRDDWESLALLSAPGAIVISRDHPLAQRDDLSIDLLRDMPFVAISREDSPGGHELLRKQCARCGFVPNIVRETATLESLFLCIEMGMGVAILDRNTRLERNSALRIIEIPDSETAGLTAVWRKDNRNPVVSALVELLKDKLRH